MHHSPLWTLIMILQAISSQQFRSTFVYNGTKDVALVPCSSPIVAGAHLIPRLIVPAFNGQRIEFSHDSRKPFGPDSMKWNHHTSLSNDNGTRFLSQFHTLHLSIIKLTQSDIELHFSQNELWHFFLTFLNWSWQKYETNKSNNLNIDSTKQVKT